VSLSTPFLGKAACPPFQLRKWSHGCASRVCAVANEKRARLGQTISRSSEYVLTRSGDSYSSPCYGFKSSVVSSFSVANFLIPVANAASNVIIAPGNLQSALILQMTRGSQGTIRQGESLSAKSKSKIRRNENFARVRGILRRNQHDVSRTKSLLMLLCLL
jgi:hypothetical protein